MSKDKFRKISIQYIEKNGVSVNCQVSMSAKVTLKLRTTMVGGAVNNNEKKN